MQQQSHLSFTPAHMDHQKLQHRLQFRYTSRHYLDRILRPVTDTCISSFIRSIVMNKYRLACIACVIFTLASGMSQVSAQDMQRPPALFTQQELDQMLAPVALYPDALLAQVLMAATYPLQIVQASRFIDSHPALQGDALAHAIAPMPWDPSVKSLTQFPSVLTMMNDQLDWTQRLGQAFLLQQANVMDTVQNLRIKAQIAGNLQANNAQRIVQQDSIIMIEPVNPQIVYIPYYNPVIVYGNWWWPQQPPRYWIPPPRYHVTINAGIAFGAGVGIAYSGYGNARPDWHRHQVLVNNVHINNVTNNITVNKQPVVWQHGGSNTARQRLPEPGNVPHPPMASAPLAPRSFNAAARPQPQVRPPPFQRPQPAPAMRTAAAPRQEQHAATHPEPKPQRHEEHPHRPEEKDR
eukprot:gene22221-23300_t